MVSDVPETIPDYATSYLPLWQASYQPPTPPHTSSSPTHPTARSEFIWRSGCFAGEFGDAFLVNTNLEGGDVPTAMELLIQLIRPLIQCTELSSCLLSTFGEVDLTRLDVILRDLGQAVKWGRHLGEIRDRPGPFLDFLNEWRKAVLDLPVGERLIINGGWLVAYRTHKARGHALLYVVERDAEDSFGFTVVNTGEGSEYHPSFQGDYPKQKRRSALRIGAIPRERMIDEAFWYLLFKMRYQCSSVHCPELLYEILLPFLAHGEQPLTHILQGTAEPYTFASNLDHEIREGRCGDFETVQRSGTCYLRAILGCLRYCCKRAGLTQAQRKQFMVAVRMCFLFCTCNDLQMLRECPDHPRLEGGWQHSDVRMIQMAVDITALALVKETQRGTFNHQDLYQFREFANTLKDLLRQLGEGRGAPRSLTLLPPTEASSTTSTEPIGTVYEPSHWELLIASGSITPQSLTAVAGDVVEESQVDMIPMNQRQSLHSMDDLVLFLSELLERSQHLQERAASNATSAALYQLTASIEHACTEVIPWPEPLLWKEGSLYQPMAFWHTPCPSTTQQKALELLHQVAFYYIHASFVLPRDRMTETIRMTVHHVFLMLLDALLRLPIQGKVTPLTQKWQDTTQPRLFWFSTDGFGNDTRLQEAYATLLFPRPELSAALQRVLAYFFTSAPVIENRTALLFHWKADPKRLKSQFRVEADDPTLRFVQQVLAQAGVAGDQLPQHEDNALPTVSSSLSHQRSMAKDDMTPAMQEAITTNTRRIEWFCADHSWLSVSPDFLRVRDLTFLAAVSLEPSEHFWEKNKEGLSRVSDWQPLWRIKSVSPAFLQCGVTVGSLHHFHLGQVRLHSPTDVRRFIPPTSNGIPTRPHSLALLFKGGSLPKDHGTKQRSAESMRTVVEEDVFNTKSLPTFEGSVDEADSETLLTLLTAPYLTIPLVLSFFAENRVDCLLNRELQNMVESVLFEPRQYSPSHGAINSIPIPPTDRKDYLGSTETLVEQELMSTPDAILRPLYQLLSEALRLCTGSYKSMFASLLLFLVRMTTRVLRVRMALSPTAQTQAPSVYEEKLYQLLVEDVMSLVMTHVEESGAASDTAQSVCLCVHLVLVGEVRLLRDPTPKTWQCVAVALAYVMVWHAAGMDGKEKGTVSSPPPEVSHRPPPPGREEPEMECFSPTLELPLSQVFLILERIRPSFLHYCSSLEDTQLLPFLDAMSRASSHECYDPKQQKRKALPGTWHSLGEKGTHSYEHSGTGIVIHLPSMEVSFSHRLLTPIPLDVVQSPHFREVLPASVQPYCVMLSQRRLCRTLQITHDATQYQIEAWSKLPSQGLSQLYTQPSGQSLWPLQETTKDTIQFYGHHYQEWSPHQAFPSPSQATWITKEDWFFPLFLTLWKNTVPSSQTLSTRFYVRQEQIDYTTELNPTVLLLRPRTQECKFWRVALLPAQQVFHVYVSVDCGRQVSQSLVFTSDCRWSWHRLAPSTEDRQVPWPAGTEWAAGELLGRPPLLLRETLTLKIQRTCVWGENVRTETFVPPSLLQGLLPDVFLECMEFWRDSSQPIIRGDLLAHPPSSPRCWQSLSEWWAPHTYRLWIHWEEESSRVVIRRVQVDEQGIEQWNHHARVLVTDLPGIESASPMGRILFQCVQLETLSHILFWSESQVNPGEQAFIDIIEFPRLTWRFQRRESSLRAASPSLQFYSMDHDDLYLSPGDHLSEHVQPFTRGLLHGALLESDNAQSFLLVPNDGLEPVHIRSCPFSTTLVAQREGEQLPEWKKEARAAACYLYPVHPSGSFLLFPSLAGALYMVVLHLLRRDYLTAATYMAHCNPDHPLHEEERWIVRHVSLTQQDAHPDAHACRLHMAILCQEWAPDLIEWSLETDLAQYLLKYSHVSADCRLTFDEEQLLLHRYDQSGGEKTLDPAIQLRLLYLQAYQKAVASGCPEEVRLPQPPVLGGSKLRALYFHADQAIHDQFQKQPCHLFFNYERPGEPKEGESALELLDALWDDNLYGQRHKTGFFLLYEMIMGVVDVRLCQPLLPHEKEGSTPLSVSNPPQTIHSELEAEEGITRRRSGCLRLAKLLLYALYFRFNVEGRGLPAETTISFTILVLSLAMMEADPTHQEMSRKLPYMPYKRLLPMMKKIRPSAHPSLRQGFWGDRSGGEADSFERALKTCVSRYSSSDAWRQQPIFMATELENASFYSERGDPFTFAVSDRWAPCRPHVDDISSSSFVIAPFEAKNVPHLPVAPFDWCDLDLSVTEVHQFAQQGFSSFPLDQWLTMVSSDASVLSYQVGDDKEDPLMHIRGEDDLSASQVAQHMLTRLENDVDTMKSLTDQRQRPQLAILNATTLSQLRQLLETGASPDLIFPILCRILNPLDTLQHALASLQGEERLRIRHGTTGVELLANQFPIDPTVDPDGMAGQQVLEKLQFLLHRDAQQRSWLRFDLLCRAFMSPSPAEELQRFNPFMNDARCHFTLTALSGVLLRSVRLCQVHGALEITRRLASSLQAMAQRLMVTQPPPLLQSLLNTDRSLVRRVLRECIQQGKYVDWHNLYDSYEQVRGSLVVQQVPEEDQEALALLLFQCPSCYQEGDSLATAQALVAYARRGGVIQGRRLFPSLPTHSSPTEGDQPSFPVLLHSIEHAGASLAHILASRRYYAILEEEEEETPRDVESFSFQFQLDPRFLVFEFVSGFSLRKRQVELVNQFVQSARQGESAVHQMIMGAGKTTVICPLLALLLADGHALVTQVVPGALLDMSRSVLRSSFSYIIRKQVYSFEMDRQTGDMVAHELRTTMDQLRLKLRVARDTSSLVVTTPETIKSLMLMYLDLLSSIESTQHLYQEKEAGLAAIKESDEKLYLVEEALVREMMTLMNEYEATADVVREILRMWSGEQGGIALLDEVDSILHPLRSELNFPIGTRAPLPDGPARWTLPFHLFGLLWSDESSVLHPHAYMSALPPSSQGNLPQRMHEVLEHGVEGMALQRKPHWILLDRMFYRQHMQPLLAEWVYWWLPSQVVDYSFDEQEEEQKNAWISYLGGGDIMTDTMWHSLSDSLQRLLNLGRLWVTNLLPHCLSKISRVHYGLLRPQAPALHDATTLQSVSTRALLCVPFLGKDAPSPASEFAHPDVLLGLTMAAYHYEGLRGDDVTRLVSHLQDQLHLEMGPYSERATHLLYHDWIDTYHAYTQQVECAPLGDTLPLESLSIHDHEAMRAPMQALPHLPAALHYYLVEIVFPLTMRHQAVKLQATGYDVGSNMLFGCSLGFSGTPSDVLPTRLRPCHFETGSEAHILSTLLRPGVAVMETWPPSSVWTVDQLMAHIAHASSPTGQPASAFIDAGALITNLSNEQVARRLLALGLSHCDGCVFLDDRDRPVIVDRSPAAPVPLHRSGISLTRRFTFYDQIHTTGMDIKQRADASAIVSIGKDTTFRDYAQACWRLRGLGQGQSLRVLLVPEVRHLVSCPVEEESSFMARLVSWLLRNSIASEHIQQMQLSHQSVAHSYRHAAFHTLLNSSAPPRGTLTRFMNEEDPLTAQQLTASIQVFREPVDHRLPSTRANQAHSHAQEIMEEIQRRCQQIQAVGIVLEEEESMTEKIEQLMALEQEALRLTRQSGASITLDTEVVQEQEQQQEKQAQHQSRFRGKYAQEKELITYWYLNPSAPDGVTTRRRRWPISTHALQQLPLYSMYTPGNKKMLPFPSALQVSFNHTHPVHRSENQRRLKRVHVILVQSTPQGPTVTLVSLAEAESLRCALMQQSVHLPRREGRITMGLMDIQGRWLYPLDGFTPEDEQRIQPLIQCCRFWNCEVRFDREDVDLLNDALANADVVQREAYWQMLLLCHKKMDQTIGQRPGRELTTDLRFLFHSRT